MDRILVEVDDISAKKWRDASEEKKIEWGYLISSFIKKGFDKSEKSFQQLLDRIGKEAEANGLTEEILNKMLSEE